MAIAFSKALDYLHHSWNVRNMPAASDLGFKNQCGKIEKAIKRCRTQQDFESIMTSISTLREKVKVNPTERSAEINALVWNLNKALGKKRVAVKRDPDALAYKNFSLVPKELFLYILKSLTLNEIARLTKVSHSFKERMGNSEPHARGLFCERFKYIHQELKKLDIKGIAAHELIQNNFLLKMYLICDHRLIKQISIFKSNLINQIDYIIVFKSREILELKNKIKQLKVAVRFCEMQLNECSYKNTDLELRINKIVNIFINYEVELIEFEKILDLNREFKGLSQVKSLNGEKRASLERKKKEKEDKIVFLSKRKKNLQAMQKQLDFSFIEEHIQPLGRLKHLSYFDRGPSFDAAYLKIRQLDLRLQITKKSPHSDLLIDELNLAAYSFAKNHCEEGCRLFLKLPSSYQIQIYTSLLENKILDSYILKRKQEVKGLTWIEEQFYEPKSKAISNSERVRAIENVRDLLINRKVLSGIKSLNSQDEHLVKGAIAFYEGNKGEGLKQWNDLSLDNRRIVVGVLWLNKLKSSYLSTELWKKIRHNAFEEPLLTNRDRGDAFLGAIRTLRE